nr:pentatricopeptide repeat-containing protein At1g10910, chloroplastic [Ipomoea trifida]
MEVSSVFGNGFHTILPHPLPFLSSRPKLAAARTSSTITSSITPTPKPIDLQNVPKNVSKDSANRLSASPSAKRSAVIEIQGSSDLSSALSRYGEILKASDINVVLRHFGKLNRKQELSQVFKWMQQNRRTNVASYSGYIKFMGNSLSYIEALEIYKSIKDKETRNNVSVCNSILGCLIKNGKPKSSFNLFTQMKQEGLVPDVVTYTTLLAGCAKVENGYSKALELVEEMKYKGLQMDCIIYGTVLSVCASHNQSSEAEKYFEQMKKEGYSPNVFHYSSLLNAFSGDGNYEKAEMLIEEMKSVGLELNKVIYVTLLKVYVKGGLFDKSKELLKELEALGLVDDEMPFCILMDGLVKAGQIPEAKLIFDEMKRKEVKSAGYSYSIMISAFCRSGLIEDAKQLASEFEGKFDKYDVISLNAMLCAYCMAGEMDNVMKMMKKMDELAINPDRNTFDILVKYFCKENLHLLAFRTMRDMYRGGHTQLDEGTCVFLIHHLGKTGANSEAFTVYNMLRYRNRTISKSLHQQILSILIKGRLLKEAYVVFKENARSISHFTIKRFANAFFKFGNINLINDVIKDIHASGHKIDQKLFYKAASRYIKQSEKKEMLLQMLQWMLSHGYVIDSSIKDLIRENSHLFGEQLGTELLSNAFQAACDVGTNKIS